ncbi:aspartate aminotransferase [Thermoplasma volcanium GSS1]|uniref:Aspartate aminotransferase n=1 Tax=Thermoplasma volcanium (strain ATCC 51530 / DSM 4299 / JCM 9571 / NBRC 15438 / GSS1) TaxID=273116 RepID=Q97BG0_THEVO|nr:pyridoxal phosphate-dependent aminotransferase [Thermoplasma volcanium]BAB59638.1 aspartate aminotransferase [Thermoplasma volcanium GSS1]
MQWLTFQWLEFIREYREKAKHNLSNSGMPEPDLKSLGIDTSYEHYLDAAGEVEYRFTEALSRRLRVDQDLIIPTVGGTEAIFIALSHLSSVSKRIHVPLPEYEPMFLVPESLGIETSKIESKVMPGRISKNESIAMTLPNNPTAQYSDRISLLDNVIHSEGLIYIDETFRDFLPSGTRPTLFDGSETMVVSGTMTKFYGLSNLRTGWIISSEHNVAGMRRIKDLTSINNASFSLYIAAQAIQKWNYFKEAEDNLINKNLRVAREYLEGLPGISYKEPEGAPFIFLSYSKNIESVKLAKLAVERYGILFAPGSFFGEEHHIRVCLTSNKPEEDFNVLKEFLKKEAV